MKTYRIVFEGREVGAIGITYRIEEEIEAPSMDSAKLKLYDRFEHIRLISIEELYS